MGNLTFPKMPLTAAEKSVAQLSQADERAICDVEHLQAPFLHAEKTLPAALPVSLRGRIVVARQLATYGFFCHEFNAVSVFWSISSIEMALKLKFRELNAGSIRLERRAPKLATVESRDVPVSMLAQHLQDGWAVSAMAYFDGSFRAYLTWAFRTNLLPDDIPIPLEEIVNGFNNRFALEIFPRRALEAGLIGANPTLPPGYALSWNSIVNTDFERAAKGCFGVIRAKFERDRELYGYAWIGRLGPNTRQQLEDIWRAGY